MLLALELGMTVAELSERLTAGEEALWIAFYQQEPFGPQRGDMRAALIAQMQYNTHSKKPKKLTDFLLFGEKRRGPPATSSQEIRENCERFVAQQKGK